MRFEEINNFLMIHLACHDIPFYHIPISELGIGISLFGKFHKPQKFSCKELKKSNIQI